MTRFSDNLFDLMWFELRLMSFTRVDRWIDACEKKLLNSCKNHAWTSRHEMEMDMHNSCMDWVWRITESALLGIYFRHETFLTYSLPHRNKPVQSSFGIKYTRTKFTILLKFQSINGKNNILLIEKWHFCRSSDFRDFVFSITLSFFIGAWKFSKCIILSSHVFYRKNFGMVYSVVTKYKQEASYT